VEKYRFTSVPVPAPAGPRRAGSWP
jgi:hypothetical protein